MNAIKESVCVCRVGRLATCCQLLCDELVSDLGYSKFRKVIDTVLMSMLWPAPIPMRLLVPVSAVRHASQSLLTSIELNWS